MQFPVYQPVGTRRDSKVFLCKNCGLCQTIQTSDPEPGKRTLSSDAGWGNVRHAKGVRLEAQKENIARILKGLPPKARILDFGSSRGQFIKWCKSEFPDFLFVGIESDRSIAETFESEGHKIHVSKFENIQTLGNEKFDFIFCNHTLEHVDNAAHALRFMLSYLNPKGILWIDVPNLEGINDLQVIEEFFIDKHMYHFEQKSLENLLQQCNFEIKDNFGDALNLVVTATPTKNIEPVMQKTKITQTDILRYQELLVKNRALLPHIAEKFRTTSNFAIYGAGRILDALIRHGGLKTDNLTVADKFLWETASGLGITIRNPEKVDWSSFEEVFVLGRSSTKEIGEWLSLNGAKKITTFQDLWKS
jgi:2-polyprenyl-3-methyl-5-hydroxy-6-metoxy-1,4-benzoquinol methylase